MSIIHVILTGGVGSRLWPLSRKSSPKQYVKIFGEHTLFQLTVLRNRPFTEKVLVVGNMDNQHLSIKQIDEINIEHPIFITEAMPRNTAPAIAFATMQVDKDDILLVTPSDHIINDPDQYSESVTRAIELAKKGYLVTFGLEASKPDTGFGYIEHDHEDVIAFKEKPDLETAKKYLQSGGHLWNSGIFCFKAGTFLDELEKYRPDIYNSSKKALNNSQNGLMPKKETMEIPMESIDCAVMEHSNILKVVPSDFKWSDLGSYDSLHQYFQKIGNKDLLQNNNLVLSKKYVEIVGLDNISVVETDDAILVLANKESQKVKDVFNKLEIENPKLTD